MVKVKNFHAYVELAKMRKAKTKPLWKTKLTA